MPTRVTLRILQWVQQKFLRKGVLLRNFRHCRTMALASPSLTKAHFILLMPLWRLFRRSQVLVMKPKCVANKTNMKNTHHNTNTRAHTHTYIYIYIYMSHAVYASLSLPSICHSFSLTELTHPLPHSCKGDASSEAKLRWCSKALRPER